LSGEIANAYLIEHADTLDEGSYDCIVSNSCGADTSGPVSIYLIPDLCMVTVDRETGYNLVVWEKKSIAPILAYNVYRESSASGIYDLLETVPYDELSIYTDTVADPTARAYLYKITAIDTSGYETDIGLCKPHKTVHLIVSTNPELNTTQLQWDRYYGFDYQSYTIYRSSTGLNFEPVTPISASLNSWTDAPALTGDLFYRIAVEKPEPCIPTGGNKKEGTGPYHHSLSNMDDNRLKEGQMPPDTITLTNRSIPEESAPATLVGKLITEDPDSIDAHAYQFVPGNGDDDNISFTLLGDLLFSSESFDFETRDMYSVRIRSTDQAGNHCEVPFLIQVLDVDETTGLPVLNSGRISVFPNPFRQEATVRFPNPSGIPYRMILTDLSGKVVRVVEDIRTSEYTLKKGDLREGIYFIELQGDKTLKDKLVIR
jgi:hypothetical protein